MDTQLSYLQAALIYFLGFIIFTSGWCLWDDDLVGLGLVTIIVGVLVWGYALLSYSWYEQFV